MLASLLKLFNRGFVEGRANECWLWRGSTNGSYGIIQVPYPRKNILAHRFTYELFVGKIPKGFVVMHVCDNPVCVNPAHLRVGTQRDNLADMARKGRRGKPDLSGERNGRAKLCEDDVKRIRVMPCSAKAAAKIFGVSSVTIHAIRAYRLWSHVL